VDHIEAIIFDLDGVILDSEHVWDEARRKLAAERGGRWHERASRDMMGMSSPDKSRQTYPPARTPRTMERAVCA
jgi:beta-phosphoglucomutase-like phosphatase (HAD superfamily)